MKKELTISDAVGEENLTAQILLALRGIRYGYVQITVQDAKVVQIEKTEKIRLDKPNLISQV